MQADNVSTKTLPARKAVGPVSPAPWHDAVLNVFGVLLLVLMGLIGIQVLASVLGINPLISFDRSVFLLGQSLNQNTLTDLQWFVLAIVGLLPAALIFLLDRHVRVDFLWQRFSVKTRINLELTGHLLFTVPFLFMSLPASWRFVMRSFNSNEMTSHGGLTDIFIVKATLPIGLGLLAAVLVWDIAQLVRLRWLVRPRSSNAQA